MEFDGGSVVYVDHFTTLALDAGAGAGAPGLSMVGGEVYVETVPADGGFFVETPHGRATDLGTRFGVDADPHGTTVLCLEGRVEASTDEGTAEVGAGQEVRLARRTGPPGPVRDRADAEARFAWAEGLGKKPAAPAAKAASAGSPVVLYAFGEGEGGVVRDVSGRGEPLDLAIGDLTAVEWLEGGGLAVASSAVISSEGPARKIIEACRASNAITIEAWIKPAGDPGGQTSRIVSLSSVRPERDFALGRAGDRYEARLRTSAFSDFAAILSPPGSVSRRVSHVVFARDAGGTFGLYVDGVLRKSGVIGGDFSNWDEGHRLILANEIGRDGRSPDRPWLGELRLVAVYDRALGPAEVARGFRAGARLFMTR
jgi:hypothetical protein